ncbi:MAG: hypothetical protein U0232_31890 [Thermomicrobiales bacterium]
MPSIRPFAPTVGAARDPRRMDCHRHRPRHKPGQNQIAFLPASPEEESDDQPNE